MVGFLSGVDALVPLQRAMLGEALPALRTDMRLSALRGRWSVRLSERGADEIRRLRLSVRTRSRHQAAAEQ